MRSPLPVIAVLVLLGGCATEGIISEPETNSVWQCTPINPLAQEPPRNPCFRAVLTAENEITLQWRVINSQQMVHLSEDIGNNHKDIGFKPAVCGSKPADMCSTSLKVTVGGFHGWRLGVKQPGGGQVYVRASIFVPPPLPLVKVTGGGFVDMLAPTSRTISWRRDDRDAAFNQSITMAWIELLTPKHTFWFGSPRLLLSGPEVSFNVPEAELRQPGYKAYAFRSCRLTAGSNTKFCSMPQAVRFYTGADIFLDSDPLYADAGKDLEISFTTHSGDVRRLMSETLIPQDLANPFLETRASSITIKAESLTPGTHTLELMSCVSETEKCSPRERIQILVDSNVHWLLGRNYTDDFLPGVAHAVLGSGAPLDVTYDTKGGIWLIKEFSNSIEYVAPSGAVKSINIPTTQMAATSDETVKPFASSVGGKKSGVPANFSELGERAVRVGSKIWFTQGGGMLGPTEFRNLSRIISYDLLLTDLPTTPYDDRLCVYYIPTDDEHHLGNNQVIGLTATTDRIWIGESRSLFGEEPSAISSFIPNPESCDNLLNIDDPQAFARQGLQYCERGRTPEQDGCMEKFLLDDLPPGLKVAHLATDPVDDTVWFTDAHGGYLGNLNRNREQVIKLYPLPDSHANPAGGAPGFGGFPWSLRADEEAVYFGEFLTRHILRFDKKTSTFHEIQVPAATSKVTLHSMDIDSKSDRLWFTLGNESSAPLNKAESTIGFIDLSSWREHITNPAHDEGVSGVIYQGLNTIGATAASNNDEVGYTGIAIDPASGKIALATFWGRMQIIELTPNAGFWR